MGRGNKEIKAVLHLPDNERTIHRFEKKLCDFYTAQVEKELRHLSKEKKLEVLQELLTGFSA